MGDGWHATRHSPLVTRHWQVSDYQLFQLQRQIAATHLRAQVHSDLLLLLWRVDARVDPLIIRALVAVFQAVEDLLASTGLFGALAGLEAPDKILGLGNILLLGLVVLEL